MELTREEKAIILQRAVINCSVEELSTKYKELGTVEKAAPALGLACRFRGLDMVKSLVEKGITFDFFLTEETAVESNCYVNKGGSHINYSCYLLKIPKKPFWFQGMMLEQSVKQDSGEVLSILSNTERVAVLQFLLEQRERIVFQPEDVLYYAIFFRDTSIYKALKESSVKLAKVEVDTIADGLDLNMGYWYKYNEMMKQVSTENCLEVLQQLALELEGKKFRCTDWNYEIIKKHFCNKEIALFFVFHFQSDKMNKTEIMRGFIDANAVEALAAVACKGWLSMPSKRDKMIGYASQNNRTEALAWLLDFKNRTADFVAEQKNADKKLMRALNAAPDSVTVLKTLWSYKKNAQGTLIITNYKGDSVEPIVPERIGKSIVTAIGQSAFTGEAYRTRATIEQLKQHRKIKKIILPKTIQSIGFGAFEDMECLEEISLPESVKQIDAKAFYRCRSLKRLSIPEPVEIIREHVFSDMSALKEIDILGSVKEIQKGAFSGCVSLEKLEIQANVEKIGASAFYHCTSLKSFVMPQGIRTVECRLFSYCKQLETVQLREGVEVIAEEAFLGCTSLKTITIPHSVKIIKRDAFFDCEQLESVYLSEGVEEIGVGAFAKCPNLKEIVLPRSIQRIKNKTRGLGFDTFEESSNLTVTCIAGSKAAAYCKRKGIRFLYK